MILLPFPGMGPMARAMAQHGGGRVMPLDLHHFADGEALVTLPAGLEGADVALVASLRDPDRLALPLRFAAATARDMGATRVGLVAPYLAYMRQDRRFRPGQAVSAQLFAGFLAESFDWLVTVDPHLHRIARLEDVFPMPALRVVAAPHVAEWIARNMPAATVLGPDSESRQWVAEVAGLAGRPYEVLHKVRTGDRDVRVSLPGGVDLRGRDVVILDDIAASGATMVQAVEKVLAQGAHAPVCVLIHAVFAEGAVAAIRAAGAARIVTTDTIPHNTNAISVAAPLAGAVDVIGRPLGGAR